MASSCEVIWGLARGSEAMVERNFHRAFENGFFEGCFPGFKAMKGCEQSPDHHTEGDVLVHTGKVFAYAAGLAVAGDDRLLLLIAALLHDMCKPDTAKKEEDGHISFKGHAEAAAKKCSVWCARLRLNEQETATVTWLVAHHMHAHELLEWGESRRLPLYQHPCFRLLVELQEADIRACWQSADGMKHGPVLREKLLADRILLLRAAAQKVKDDALRKRVTALLQARGIQPGPFYGQVGKAAVIAATTIDFSFDDALKHWFDAYIVSAT